MRAPSYLESDPGSSGLEPPAKQPGGSAAGLRRLKKALFSGPISGATTIVLAAALIWAGDLLFHYLISGAVWTAEEGGACRAAPSGACWAFIWAKLDFFRYGAYPSTQRWRVDAAWLPAAVLIGAMARRGLNAGPVRAPWALIFLPLAAFLVAPGPFGDAWRNPMEMVFLAAAALLAAALILMRAQMRILAVMFFVAYPIYAFTLLHGAPFLHLPIVDTNFWGGLLVTLLVSIVGIVASVPAGVLLALGRRSKLPAVRLCCTGFIELMRGVPVVTILFMANTMLPLFVPPRIAPDRLVRPLVGVSLFAAAVMAEVVRAGLQAIPKGQDEAARALGLAYSQSVRLVILPQALALVTPAIVGACIALFMDTTLVASVGIYDFLGTLDAARSDPAWASASTSTTAYVFAAMVYWAVCFGMSRYARAVERRTPSARRRKEQGTA